MVDLLRNRDNAVSAGFVAAALLAPLLFWLCFEWHWWFLLASIVILAFACIAWLTLPLTTTGSLTELVPPRETPVSRSPFTPDSAASETHRILKFAFPDAHVRAMVEKDLVQAAWERGYRDYANALQGRLRRPD